MILEDYGSFELIRSETFSCKVKKKNVAFKYQQHTHDCISATLFSANLTHLVKLFAFLYFNELRINSYNFIII